MQHFFLKGFSSSLCLPAICTKSVAMSIVVFLLWQSLMTKVDAQVE